MIECALRYDKPVRIGVNWGSLDQELLARLMDENAQRAAAAGRRRGDARGADPLGARIGAQARKSSACPRERIVLSCKVSRVQDLIAVYRDARARAATTRCTSA